MRTLLAPRLSPGDAVGVIAPAGPFDRERFARGMDALESLGLTPVFDERVFARQAYLAGPDQDRAGQVRDFVRDPQIKALIAARGGYGTMRLLNLLDYRDFYANPKPVIGFSDLTALLLAINQRTGLVCLHGPVVTQLAEAGEPTRASLAETLFTGRAAPLDFTPGQVVHPGRAAGRLIGGNLSLLVHLLGSAFAPRFEGCILFLEDVNEPPYRLDRLLTALALAGVWERVAGLALGWFPNCGGEEEVEAVLGRCLGALEVPVVRSLPFGHAEPNLTLPFGAQAELDTEAGRLSFPEPCLD